jgi:hypothetical protein
METILGLQLPGDLTLGESKKYIENSKVFDELKVQMQPHKRPMLRIRFLSLPSREELSDDMTIREFQALAKQDKAVIAIDDQGGGQKVKEEA